MPEVSVVIPTYNYARFLRASISSVLGQTFQDLELVVVDDGSTDETRSVVAEFEGDSRVRYIYQANRGDASARNTGIANTSGRYLAFLDADDLWLPGKLQKQVDVLRNQPQISAVHSAAYIQKIDQRQRVLASTILRKPGLTTRTLYEELLYRNVIVGSHSSVMLRREALSEVGVFDEDFHICDIDLWRRLAEHHLFWYLDEPLTCIRKHGANISADLDMMSDEFSRYFSKLQREVSPRHRHHLPRVLVTGYWLLTLQALRAGHYGRACAFSVLTLWSARRRPFFAAGLFVEQLIELALRGSGGRAARPVEAHR